MCSRHAATGSVGVEARDRGDLLPQALDVGRSEYLVAQPSVGQAITVQAHARRSVRSRRACLSASGSARAARAGSTSWNRFGSASPDDVDERRLLARARRLHEPVGCPVEQLVGRMDRVETPQMVVDVVAVHVTRPGPPAGLRDRSHERRVLRLGADDEALAGTEPRADDDGELGVALEMAHGASLSRRSAARQPRRAADERRPHASRRRARTRFACRSRSRSGSRDRCRGSRIGVHAASCCAETPAVSALA